MKVGANISDSEVFWSASPDLLNIACSLGFHVQDRRSNIVWNKADMKSPKMTRLVRVSSQDSLWQEGNAVILFKRLLNGGLEQ